MCGAFHQIMVPACRGETGLLSFGVLEVSALQHWILPCESCIHGNRYKIIRFSAVNVLYNIVLANCSHLIDTKSVLISC